MADRVPTERLRSFVAQLDPITRQLDAGRGLSVTNLALDLLDARERSDERATDEGRDAIRQVMLIVLQAYVRSRDFMGLQLDHAFGNIDDEEFNQRAETYLAHHETRTKEDAARLLSVLASCVDIRQFDPEFLSHALDASLDDVLSILTAQKPR